MAKLTIKEFIEKWESKLAEADDDTTIEFREDVSDSVQGESEELAEAKATIEKLTADLADSKQRYKDRFLTSEEIVSKEEEIKAEDEEPKEEEIIDVKEI